MQSFTAVYTVTNENMATVYNTSHHLVPSSLRWTGLKSAAIHWKNRMTTAPRTNRAVEVSANRWIYGRGYRKELSR